MKIEIIPLNKNQKHLFNIISYLNRSEIKDYVSLEIKTSTPRPGEMSAGGLLDGIVAIFKAANAPLVELVRCLRDYTKTFSTDIIMRNENGKEIIINTRKLDEKNINELVKEFLKT